MFPIEEGWGQMATQALPDLTKTLTSGWTGGCGWAWRSGVYPTLMRKEGAFLVSVQSHPARDRIGAQREEVT